MTRREREEPSNSFQSDPEVKRRRERATELYGDQIGPALIDLLEMPNAYKGQDLKNLQEARQKVIHFIALEAGNLDPAIRERAFSAFADFMSRELLHTPIMVKDWF